MKTFIQWLIEYPDLVPAIKNHGKVYRGREGEGHSDILHQHKKAGGLKQKRGFWSTKQKKFMGVADMNWMRSLDQMTDKDRDHWLHRVLS